MSKFLRKTQFEHVIKSLWDKAKEKFVEDITFDKDVDSQTNKPKNTLKKTKNGQTEDVVNHVVTEWKDLEYATQSTNFNIFNPSIFKDGEYYNSIGTLEKTPNWGNFKIPCSGGDTFTLFKKTHDSINLGLLSGGRWVQNLKVSYNNDNGWVKYTINIPQTGQFDSISIPVHNQTNNYKSGVMLFSGDVQAPAEFIPFTNNRVVSIDGSKVALTFDATGSSLTSSTTHDAIKELDSKIANAGGGTVTSVNGVQPVDGNVTVGIDNINTLRDELNNRVLQSELTSVGGNAQYRDKIPQLGADGKLSETMIPDLAITRVITTDNGTTAEQLVTSGQIQVGDVVVLTQDENKVYMYNGNTQGNFENKFIELSSGDVTVKTINNHRPTNGNFTFALEETDTKLNLKVNNNIITQVDFATQMDIEVLKNSLSFR